MAIVLTLSNHYKYQLAAKKIDLSADTLKIILMNNTFVFDKDTHATLASVTASQLATTGGYTQNSKTLLNQVLSEDDTNNKGKMVCSNVVWTGTGDGFGPTGALIIYNDTTTDDTVVGCADFGTDYTVAATATLTIKSIELDLV